MCMEKLKEVITGDDNHTLDASYMWGAVFAVTGLCLEVYCTITGKPFDLQAYGIGAGALLVGLGLGKKLGQPQQ